MNFITHQHANPSLSLSPRHFYRFHQHLKIRQSSCTHRHHYRYEGYATQTVSTQSLSSSLLRFDKTRTCNRMTYTMFDIGGIRSSSSCIGNRNPWNNNRTLLQQYLHHTTNNTRSMKWLLFSTESSPFSSKSKKHSNSNSNTRKQRPSFRIPKKAPVNLTPKARQFFKALLQNKIQNNANDKNSAEEIVGILLQYQQSKTGEPRMVFTFDFVTQNQLGKKDEPVSLEVVTIATDVHAEDADVDTNTDADDVAKEMHSEIDQGKEEIPKSPEESYNDGLPKLYIHEHAFMKVLGCTIDIDMETFTPILYDREGNVMDPNA